MERLLRTLSVVLGVQPPQGRHHFTPTPVVPDDAPTVSFRLTPYPQEKS